MSPSQLNFSGIALSPLFASLLAMSAGNIWGSRKFAHVVTIIGILISLCFAFSLLPAVLAGHTLHGVIYNWIFSKNYSFDISVFIDQLSLSMILVVDIVSLMVHIYSIGYMSRDKGYQRFFSYISLFTFFMLVLIVSDNLLQLFFGWEGVGLVSYLLIGFWYDKPSAVKASFKAFVVNRVGDVGFVLGMAIIFGLTKTLNISSFTDILLYHSQASVLPIITLACLALFIGAMSKSAQFPLHIWLPDSMEGPTPISALIHAATMVTAGVFMVVRLMPVFRLSPNSLSFILIISGITAFFLGLVALVQNDIKRIIAYSTISQLGYMCVAIGLDVPSFAIFHLLSHAFFKALLFLSAGSVIVAMHHEQDIRNMGGLCRYMPITWISFLVGGISLLGFPFTSGFYSKHMILDSARIASGWAAQWAYYTTFAGVFVTACYTSRMFFTVFHGKERFPLSAKSDNYVPPSESPFSIVIPLVVLSIFSLFFGCPFLLSIMPEGLFSNLTGNLSPLSISIFKEIVDQGGLISFTFHSFMSASFLLLVLGVVVGWLVSFDSYLIVFMKRLSIFSCFHTLLYRKYYLDELAEAIFAFYLKKCKLASWVDNHIIDYLVNTVARTVSILSDSWRIMQTGFIGNYALFMFCGVLVILFVPMFSLFYS